MKEKFYQSSFKPIIPEETIRKIMEDSAREKYKVLIQQKLIEIDSFRNAKREILKGDSSPIVKGCLANDIENRIEMLKSEIMNMIEGY